MPHTCANCGKEGEKFPKCSKCKTVWYCTRECQKAHWTEHKKVCTSVSEKQEKEEKPLSEDDVVPDPEWEIEITVHGEDVSNYKALLAPHPVFSKFDLVRYQTALKDWEVKTIPLVPTDTVDATITSLKYGTKVEYKNLPAEEFVKKTDAARCQEGCRFGATGTTFDNWDHKTLYFRGMGLTKAEYPGAPSDSASTNGNTEVTAESTTEVTNSTENENKSVETETKLSENTNTNTNEVVQ